MSNVNSLPVIAGVEITTDAEGRFNLNALHQASGEGRHKSPAQWLRRSETKALIAELEDQDVNLHLAPISKIHGGIAPGTFAHELLAVEYAGWISPAFRLKVNQTFIDFRKGNLGVAPEVSPLSPSLPELQIAECAARMLRMSDSSKVRMLSTICTERGVSDRFLPDYVEEARVKALSDLLKDYEVSLSARAVNPILMEMGYLEELGRRSSKGSIKKFKSLTEAGLRFGKNETSPRSPKETQPLYYVETFPELLDQINAWKSAA
ncbi:KilA-N domain-containing protein [Microbulbifer sp. TRSA002]|uniref:KilA-N domain-containing protein n=1 Tax=Microbulbifer sp. TRSA002 TaxID=3243382 RepID=UPI00403912BB